MHLHCVLTLLALFGIPVSECLQCFNCQNINDPQSCTGQLECLDNQSCFVQTVHSGNEVLYNMGCQNNQLCSSLPVDHSGIIGRSVQTRQQNRCHDCCSTDYCQKEQPCAQREVDGQWGSWTAWSLCTSHCNQTRNRACDKPSPLHGGRDCPGLKAQAQVCITSSCLVADCSDLLRLNATLASGVYRITTPLTHSKLQVYCDMETDGGGWTVFQKRFNGSVDFYRNFSEYENGFGFVDGEHWLGLKYLHEMASLGSYQLRLDIVRSNGSKGFDVYDNFILGPGPNYTFHIGSRLRFSGCRSLFEGSSFSPNDQSFTTYDHNYSRSINCADRFHGAWWYNMCFNFNANGLYDPGIYNPKAMAYNDNVGLSATTLMFKRI
ncbi:ficolin-1-like [Dreissena polymorpha]|uniref:Fibrinogen C-terminal domain-containing protein n=1 Tax=Dreissena polymorpha TaxID=45954 RepID=A0A9D4IFH9_DREPO|nr:ficolin-1-like [Dreissena polymorpha]KAH3772100.1 hypothetical protein DPMN_173435 [Dreissena polymorpha]